MIFLVLIVSTCLSTFTVKTISALRKEYVQGDNGQIEIRDDLIPRRNFKYYNDDDDDDDDGPIIPGLSKRQEGELALDNAIRGRGGVVDVIGGIVIDSTKGTKWEQMENIRYLLKKRGTSSNWVVMKRRGTGSHSNWISGKPIKVLIHGFNPKPFIEPTEALKQQHQFGIGNAYASGEYNVIIVDWTSLASHSLIRYYDAVEGTKFAAHDIAEFLIHLKNRGLFSNWADVHMIGFSLGAHVAGGAAFRIKKKTNGKIGRITGIDPAGPSYHDDGRLPHDTTDVLEQSDADFVDIIHCNMGKTITMLGTPVQSGHVDFYPNGGKEQKGCSSWQTGCSHNVCPNYFIKSITGAYLACPCASWDKYEDGKCSCTKKSGGTYFGEPTDVNARGKFYLRSLS